MSHLTNILERQKQLSSELTELFGETSLAGHQAESMPTNDPNYLPMMTKQDDAVDMINAFHSDLSGLISDIKTLAGA